MKAQIEIELQPFEVPNFVLTVQEPRPKQEGFQETPKYPLSHLSPETLERLCNEFRDAVFAKAGKQHPPKCMPGPSDSKYR